MDSEQIRYEPYTNDIQVSQMKEMIDQELSEPYSIYTYLYFIKTYPELTFIAYLNDQMVGVIIGKLEKNRKEKNREILFLIIYFIQLCEISYYNEQLKGYLAMIVVQKQYRRHKIGQKLVSLFLDQLTKMDCDELVLETESCNKAALNFYENLGFLKHKRMLNYYMNGNDAFRLMLQLKEQKQE